ncbi:MAG: response regulator [Chloroflexi bacterium]|nr:response regulator [Chloroflexota bacterium]
MRILLADSQPRVRFALRVLMAQQPGVTDVVEVADAAALVVELRAGRADLLLLDWDLPGLAEAGGLRALRPAAPQLGVLCLSGRPGARRAALAAGADAFVSKSDPPERLVDAVRCCSDRQPQTG